MKKDTFNKKQLHQLSKLCKEGKHGSQLDKDLWNLRYLRYSVLFGSFEYQSGIIATLDRAIRKLEEEKKNEDY